MKFLYAGGGLSPFFGILTAPNHKGIPLGIMQGKPWGADLGCLEGPNFVKKIYLELALKWLEKMRKHREKCLFVAGFDIVGNAKRTLAAYQSHKKFFEGWPLAYIAQDGAEDYPIPDDCETVFIGGSTAWKESLEAMYIIEQAVRMGKHIHIGRVNWWNRYQLFRALPGSDNFTCDGTRQRFEGHEKTVNAWQSYEKKEVKGRSVPFPKSYLW